MLKKENYSLVLAEKDTYKTISRRTHVFPSPAMNFYLKLIKIVIDSGKQAKQGKYGPVEWVQSSLDILAAIESVGVEFEITGMKNISSFDGPAVFISNHMSTLETVILPSLIQPKKEVTFVVKKELLDYPYFGHILSARNPIIVGRSNPREDLTHVMTEGGNYIKQGRSIIIFPQRTRSSMFNAESFNTLGVKLAKKSDCYVVPLALVTDSWGNGRMIKELGKIDTTKKVYISFGEPFKVGTNGTKEHAAVLEFIRSKLIEWNREDCIAEHSAAEI